MGATHLDLTSCEWPHVRGVPRAHSVLRFTQITFTSPGPWPLNTMILCVNCILMYSYHLDSR